MTIHEQNLNQILEPTERAARLEDTTHALLATSEIQLNALTDLVAERKYQDGIWGQARDRDISESLWLKAINDYATGRGRARDYEFRKRMVKVAAIALAAIEAHDGKIERQS